MERVKKKKDFIAREIERIEKEKDDKGRPLVQALRLPEARYSDIAQDKNIEIGIQREIEVKIKYKGFIRRQLERKEKLRAMQETEIPQEFNYNEIRGLSNEAREKLGLYRPFSLGQASRISGLTSEDISILLVHLERSRKALEKQNVPYVTDNIIDDED